MIRAKFWAVFFAAALLYIAAPVSSAQAACANPVGAAGDLYYNTSFDVLQYCNNTDWVATGRGPGTGGGCASPAGVAGQIYYNTDYRVTQFCNGNEWVAMGAVGGRNGWKQISAGSDVSYGHTCGIKNDNTLWCWGTNSYGSTGLNTASGETLVPTQINGGGTWNQVSAGLSHTCAIKSDDKLYCWGNNNSGRTGLNTTVGNTLVPTEINGGGTWKLVSTANNHTCGIKSDDTLYCWGGNGNGRTGLNTTTGNALVPTGISGGGSWKTVTTGSAHSCGIKSDDTLYCWGSNGSGATGLNTTAGDTLVPTGISGGGAWKTVSTGAFGSHGCGIKSDDTVWCWGWNSSGQLGDNSMTQRLVPTAISGGGSWKSIDLGQSYSCGIKADNTLYCWGDNDSGQLGDGTTADRLVPTAVNGGGAWSLITGAYQHTCGIRTDGQFLCWGRNRAGEHGDNSMASTSVPTLISDSGAWLQVTMDPYASCAIKSDSKLYCWGYNTDGELGSGSQYETFAQPTEVSGGGSWIDVAMGGRYHTCGIKLGGSLWCWGGNVSGQLGDNTTTTRLLPTAINGGGTWKQVTVGDNHSCAIKSDNSLWCWGWNSSGQLGDNSTTQRLVPTAINGGGTWKAVDAGSSFTCAIKSDYTLWCWGSNSNGKTGLNTSAGTTLVPTQVDGGAWTQVSSAFFNACGLKSDGTAWCWGQNWGGELGDGTTTQRLVPTAVVGGHTWNQIHIEDTPEYQWTRTCGIKNDETLWCWGEGIATPAIVPGGGTWRNVKVQGGRACAIATSGQMYCWGVNDNGELTGTETSAPYRTTATTPWCGGPTGRPGSFVYNTSTNTLQYCDGAGWARAGR